MKVKALKALLVVAYLTAIVALTSVKQVQFLQLLLFYSISFSTYFAISFYKRLSFSSSQLFIVGILAHVLFFFQLPFLSQDVYRFIIDGELIIKGIDPYQFLPIELAENTIPNQNFLVEKIGELSRTTHSSYPPINQFFFSLTAKLFSGQIFWQINFYRFLMLLSAIGTTYFLLKLFKTFNRPPQLAFLYLLNPLVIIETTGNIHFEGIIVFFLVMAIFYLKKNTKIAALCFGIGASIKLLPFILVPAILNYLGFKKGLSFLIVITIIFFTPLLLFPIQSIQNLVESVLLWMNKFEFNASIYFIARWIGFQLTGYNQIAIIGKLLSAISLVLILFFSFRKKIQNIQELLGVFFLVYTSYLLFATTIHPWYILIPFALSAKNNWVFLVWTYLIILSYIAYSNFSQTAVSIALVLEYAFLAYSILISINKKKPNF